MKIIPAGSGIRALTALERRCSGGASRTIIQTISAELDFLLIDTAAGISDNVVELLLLAERVLVVTSFEPGGDRRRLRGDQDSDDDGAGTRTSASSSTPRAMPTKPASCSASSTSRPTRFLDRSLRFDGFIVQDPGGARRGARTAPDRRSPAAGAGEPLFPDSRVAPGGLRARVAAARARAMHAAAGAPTRRADGALLAAGVDADAREPTARAADLEACNQLVLGARRSREGAGRRVSRSACRRTSS